MMRATTIVVCAVITSLCSSCASFQDQPTDRVPTSVIINSLKCDIAKYFSYERAHLGPPFILENGKPINVTLTLNIVDERLAGGSIDLAPSVLMFSGASLGLGLSGHVKRTATVERTTQIIVTPSARNVSICERAGRQQMEGGIGLYSTLVATRSDIAHTQRGEPFALIDKIGYSTSFAVERSFGGNASYAFVAIKAGLDASETRSDVQKIEVNFETKKAPTGQPAKPCDPARETCPMKTPLGQPAKPCDPTRETCPLRLPAAKE
jgi:hypothetical protein